jgi:SAM-dependent methyltransferase
MDKQPHWEKIWTKYRETELSWFQDEPTLSLDLIKRYAESRDNRIIDAGGGGASLVDGLLAAGYKGPGVLDISNPALEVARARLGDRSNLVNWIVSDVLEYEPAQLWDVWHDRAVFHFLTAGADRALYRDAVLRSLNPSGFLIIATFALEGPNRCSGLDVIRHGPESIEQDFGTHFRLVEHHDEIHRTPANVEQKFNYFVLKRVDSVAS